MSSLVRTPSELLGLSIVERVCSVLSLLGCVLIIATFCLSNSFHTPINRLIFYASLGNVLCNVGTLMSTSFVDSPDSVGCQTQALIIQWFMPADTLFSFAMAINVYLTFFWRFDAYKLRKIEPLYLVCCYGVPFVPALVYLFIRDGNGHRPYGSATLWCWIASEWSVFRITTFYGPVWLVIIATFFIYLRAGRTIYLRRKQLLNFSSADLESSVRTTTDTAPKMTGVVVTTTSTLKTEVNPGTEQLSTDPSARSGAYSVDIFADTTPSVTYAEVVTKTIPERPGRTRQTQDDNMRSRTDNAAWSYTKCAILFFSAMLITWIPSSANRVHYLVHGTSSPALEYMSAFVLPLQGFWNAVIYVATSRAACRNLLNHLRLGSRPAVGGIMGRDGVGNERIAQGHRLEHLKTGTRGTESTASLAGRQDNASDRE